MTWTSTGVIGNWVSVVNGMMLVATGRGGVVRSTDNGATWTAPNSSLTSTDVERLAVNGSNLFTGNYGDGVFLSTTRVDAGPR